MQNEMPNESIYKALVEAIPDAVMYSDFNGTIRFANNRAVVMGGFNSTDELIGLNMFEFIADQDKTSMADAFQRLARGVNKGTIEAILLRKDGSKYDAELTGSIVKDEQQHPVGFISITRDIGTRKAMENILAAAKSNADKANHLKDAFISNISHEIRTPLNAIIGFSELIKEETSSKISDEANNYFQIIDNSCKRLLHTVELMLDLSKLQTGMFAPSKSMVDPDLIIKRLITEYQPAARQKSLKIMYVNNIGSGHFLSDVYCINQSIATLLNNAVKYTREGSINITLSRISPNLLSVEVADTGIGMHPDYINHIFEPFSTEETGNTKKFNGIGLSLAIAKKLLQTIGAEISVTSSQGKGSIFTVNLPVS